MRILGHRAQHRHLDENGGGKGYTSCGCCGSAVTIARRKQSASYSGTIIWRCSCARATKACLRCGRCPEHGRCAPKACMMAPTGEPASPLIQAAPELLGGDGR